MAGRFENCSWELESKGWFDGLEITVDEKTFNPIFYDVVRLSQDIAEEISAGRVFVLQNLVVVERVCREAMESAVANLAQSDELRRLISSKK
ncbi:MAG: hypothetical protein JWO82_1104 [Akkermansiaceae bacterium]|nr:hypothetical protein [Akkermansiaceae bacterium]